jgi:hypothetical protein
VIVIQQSFPGDKFYVVEIDGDRAVGVSNTKDGSLYLRFKNGDMWKNMLITKECGLALVAALEAAMESA